MENFTKICSENAIFSASSFVFYQNVISETFKRLKAAEKPSSDEIKEPSTLTTSSGIGFRLKIDH